MTTQSARTNAIQLLATARRLARRNRWQRLGRRRVAIVVLLFMVALFGLAWLAWLAMVNASAITDGIDLAVRFPVVVMIVAGWITLVFAVRQRRQSRRDAERSWLAALPLGAQAFAAAARRRIALTTGVALATACALLFALGRLLSLPGRSILTVALLLIVGSLVGVLTGWSLAREDRRRSRIRLPSSAANAKSQRFSLGRWPLSHSRAHADFALHARAIGALLLSFPIGVPPLIVIATIVFGLTALVIHDQSRALFAVTRHAGAWLRSLPLSPRNATVELGSRSLPIIIVAAITLVVAATPVGMRGITAVVIVVAISAVVASGYVALAAMQQPFGARR